MIHRDCSGKIKEDWSNPYYFEGDDAKAYGATVPRYICDKCNKEILGDSELFVEGIDIACYVFDEYQP